MPGKDLFEKPFDDGTLDKLLIYKEYLKEWLPVFVSRPDPNWKVVQIFDFFAGKGRDINGAPGSPLIAIEVINLFKQLAFEHGVKVVLHLNEVSGAKHQALLKNIEGMDSGFEIRVYKEKFEKLFEKLYPSMRDSANFLFLDQNGIKEITENIFARITALRQTDFLFLSLLHFSNVLLVRPSLKNTFRLQRKKLKQRITSICIERYWIIINP